MRSVATLRQMGLVSSFALLVAACGGGDTTEATPSTTPTPPLAATTTAAPRPATSPPMTVAPTTPTVATTTTTTNTTTTTTVPSTGTCSTTGLDLVLERQPDLPAPVAATRHAIFDAARACDYDTIQALADAGDEFFTASFGGSDTSYYADLEARGSPALADMARHLNQPHAATTDGDGTVYHTWPSAFVQLESAYGDGLLDADYRKLLELYSVEDLEAMFDGIGGYVGWRHGILEDGEWWFFVAGD